MKKNIILIAILGMTLVFGIVLTGCPGPHDPDPTKYTVTFNADGGTVSPASKEVISGNAAGTLPTPTKSGNNFGGWYTAQNGGGSSFTATSVVTAPITVYAQWISGEPTEYTVTFNAEGGTVSPASKEVISGNAAGTLPTPTKSGNNFFGWFTKNGTGGDWGDSFTTATVVTADITVYAQWGSGEPTLYTVTFNADGGTVSPASKEVISGNAAGTLPTPTKSGSNFGGWYTAQNGGGSSFTATSVVTGDITVYAEWLATNETIVEHRGTWYNGGITLVIEASQITISGASTPGLNGTFSIRIFGQDGDITDYQYTHGMKCKLVNGNLVILEGSGMSELHGTWTRLGGGDTAKLQGTWVKVHGPEILEPAKFTFTGSSYMHNEGYTTERSGTCVVNETAHTITIDDPSLTFSYSFTDDTTLVVTGVHEQVDGTFIKQ
ncbi:InlB B-repeat-containing protein [Treponema primitia]|uniref:InlB B-repeat-containing protein n=1 Tax=Treponema primitia TaxID=88058 RepID=UPI003980C95C